MSQKTWVPAGRGDVYPEKDKRKRKKKKKRKENLEKEKEKEVGWVTF